MVLYKILKGISEGGALNRNAELFSYQIKKERRRRTCFFIVFFICLYVFINLILHFLIYPVKQNSVSMIPDISQKSVVLVSPVSESYNRGDIVLLSPRAQSKTGFFKRHYAHFVSFFTAQQYSPLESVNIASSKQHIRRVVGMPGDTIYMRGYVLYIKPAGERHFLTEFEITPEPYNVTFYVPPADWDTEIGVKGSFDEITLGADEYFLLADNRKSSDDSRLWGVIKKDEISAKVLMCYFPFKNFRIF